MAPRRKASGTPYAATVCAGRYRDAWELRRSACKRFRYGKTRRGKPRPTTGTFTICGPSLEWREWYARVELRDGVLVRVIG